METLAKNFKIEVLVGVEKRYDEECNICGGIGIITTTTTSEITCSRCENTRKLQCTTCGGSAKINCTECQNGYKIISGETKTCTVCNGTKNITCTKCVGSGTENCSCGENHERDCPDCSGGKVECETCWGTGDVECSNCYGSGCEECEMLGQVQCSDCVDGEISCTFCSGSGKVDCTLCNNGVKECTHCKGTLIEQCTGCFGAGVTTTSGTEVPCGSCTNGKKTCTTCSGKGYVPCEECSPDDTSTTTTTTTKYCKCYKTIERYTTLTLYNNGVSNEFASFNENISEKEYSQSTFTFDVEKYSNGKRNLVVDLLCIDRKIKLTLGSEVYCYYVTKITPKFHNSGVRLTIECQDSFSYVLSKQYPDISFSTEDTSLWGEENIGPQTLSKLMSKLLERYGDDWILLNYNKAHFMNDIYNPTDEMKVTIEMSNTTPYNVFIEIIKLFNAVVKFDYENKTISLTNKEFNKYKGIRLKPNINLSSFSYAESGDNLYNIMYVKGGETSDGNIVTIIPNIPTCLQIIYGELYENRDEKIDGLLENPYIYPTCYYYLSDGELKLYKKTETEIGNKEYYYVEQEVTQDWRTARTIEELRVITKELIEIYWGQNALGEEELKEVNEYFDSLKKIPHASNFIYNFEYWKEKGLLTQNEYNELLKTLEVDYRNVNIMTTIYTILYNSLKYELDRKIKLEEEKIMEMAQIDSSRVNYEPRTDEDEMATKAFYLSYCKSYKDGEKTCYYVPIGLIQKQSENYYVDYGLINSSDLSQPQYLPDLFSLGNGQEISYFVNGTRYNATIENYNDNKININNATTEAKDKIAYINYENLRTMKLNRDSGCQNRINELSFELYNLWDENYTCLYYSLEGENWLRRKKKKIADLKNKKLGDKNKVIEQLQEKFGDNWIDYSKANKNLTLEITRKVEYDYLYKKLQDLSIYVGGIGVTKDSAENNKEYKGYYDFYELMLDTLIKNYSGENNNTNNSILTKLDNIKRKKEEIEERIYVDYGRIIRSCIFEDTNQLNSRDLFMSAYKQFLNYNSVGKSYSSSYISSTNFEILYETVEIGDKVELLQEGLNESQTTNKFKLFLNKKCSLGFCKLQYRDKDGYPKSINGKVLNCERNVATIILERELDTSLRIISLSTVQDVFLVKYMTNYSNSSRILNIEGVFDNNPISLRITGLNKNLRSNIINLTIEENTLYNTLVSRMAFMLLGR